MLLLTGDFAAIESRLSHSYLVALRSDPCSYCGERRRRRRRRTVDHIQPRSRGGPDSWPNLAGACATCNQAKGDQSLLMFLARRTMSVAG